MSAELNHTIIPVRDPPASARFLAGILGLPVDPPLAHVAPVTLINGVKDAGITYYADPAGRQAGQVCTSDSGRRGACFRDPDGHLMEIIARTAKEQA